jgi:hypothetical protein
VQQHQRPRWLLLLPLRLLALLLPPRHGCGCRLQQRDVCGAARAAQPRQPGSGCHLPAGAGSSLFLCCGGWMLLLRLVAGGPTWGLLLEGQLLAAAISRGPHLWEQTQLWDVLCATHNKFPLSGSRLHGCSLRTTMWLSMELSWLAAQPQRQHLLAPRFHLPPSLSHPPPPPHRQAPSSCWRRLTLRWCRRHQRSPDRLRLQDCQSFLLHSQAPNWVATLGFLPICSLSILF